MLLHCLVRHPSTLLLSMLYSSSSRFVSFVLQTEQFKKKDKQIKKYTHKSKGCIKNRYSTYRHSTIDSKYKSSQQTQCKLSSLHYQSSNLNLSKTFSCIYASLTMVFSSLIPFYFMHLQTNKNTQHTHIHNNQSHHQCMSAQPIPSSSSSF